MDESALLTGELNFLTGTVHSGLACEQTTSFESLIITGGAVYKALWFSF